MADEWQFWIDVGGTFTDCIARQPDGALLREKVLSSGVIQGAVENRSTQNEILDTARRSEPANFWAGYRLTLLDEAGKVVGDSQVAASDVGLLKLERRLGGPPRPGQTYQLASGEEAPVLAIRRLLQLGLNKPFPKISVRLGTTRGTNALLTRQGARTAFITTAGFGDVLRIGNQDRPRLFDLAIEKPSPLYALGCEIDERITHTGEVLQPVDEERTRRQLGELRRAGVESLAVCLLNAYQHPRHELAIERLARDVGFDEISLSHRVAPLVKLVSRGDTTVVDAYLNPVLRLYFQRLRESLGKDCDLRLMTSAGGLVDAPHFTGKDSVLSGPAGGVVGAAHVGQTAGFQRVIGFDMGGTSTDVSRFDGRFERQFETVKAGVRIVAPMMAIETVAAGGGSICAFDGVKLTVGPASAGADPGPACYGRGGPLAVTDVNLLLGKLSTSHFPFTLDRQAVERRLGEILDQIQERGGPPMNSLELAEGFLRVANANMVQAIRSISIAKGYNPEDYALVAFGGAAPQHACGVAKELGVRSIINHPDGGILSALGIGLADVRRHVVRGVYQPLNRLSKVDRENLFAPLCEDARNEVREQGIAADQIQLDRAVDLRYVGVDACLTIDTAEDGDLAAVFAKHHQQRYGYVHDREIELVALRVEAIGRSSQARKRSSHVSQTTPEATHFTKMYFDGQWRRAAVHERADLCPGDRIRGPAMVLEQVSTTIIDPSWSAELLSGGELLLTTDESTSDSPVNARNADEVDPVLLEVFNNHFASIAEQMGITLQNTSSSVNVKERLDFSCAIFTPEGDLVVNAPHIPVHLGAMSETVKSVLNASQLVDGDVVVTNDPFDGGSHLPDITVVTPVFQEHSDRLLFLTASRAHHAEIGGITPGSMPPHSRCLQEEGVLIRHFQILKAGVSRVEELEKLLLSGPHPSRNAPNNLADISAQMAANRQGARDLRTLIERQGADRVLAYMRHIQVAAEQKMRRALSALPDGRRTFTDHLDCGATIQATVDIEGDSATIDFTGTSPALKSNLNANRAIVMAAVMYCMRCLIGEDIPLNQGVLKPIHLILPNCLLNPRGDDDPAKCPAVAGGNVETSQRVVDVLLGALELAAASQGTMNNTLFGDGEFGYYETVCGGAGATTTCDGADAVHTHMTNTRITDAEVMERRFPVRVLEFSIRRHSGGAGKYRGGDGVVRRIEFLKPLELSLLSQRRGPYPPYGLHGGEPGMLGANQLVRASGEHERLAAVATTEVQPGDVLIVETPGGGGCHAANPKP